MQKLVRILSKQTEGIELIYRGERAIDGDARGNAQQ